MWFTWWQRLVNRRHISRRRSRSAQNRKQTQIYRPWAEVLEGRLVPANVFFTNQIGDGNWGNAGNWSNNALPTRFDDATININVAVTHSSIDEVHSLTQTTGSLTLTGGNLSVDAPSFIQQGATVNFGGGDLGIYASGTDHTLPGTLTINGVFNWNAGRIRGGSLNIGPHGLGNFSGIFGEMDLGIVGEAAVINNAGQIQQSNTHPGGDLVLDNATLNNLAGGLYLFTGSAPVNIFSANSTNPKLITNAGIIRQVAGTNASTIGVSITNATSGLLDVQSGSLVLTAGATGAGGNINVASGASLDLSGGSTPTYSGTFTGSGAGTVVIQGGIVTITTATFNFPAGMFQWTAGTIQGGSLTNAGFMTWSNKDNILTNDLFLGGNFTNSGTIIDNLNAGRSFHFMGATIFNQASGLFVFQNDSGFVSPAASFADSFSNAGTVRKTGGTGNSQTLVLFDNSPSGVIDVRTGTISLIGGGINSGGTFNAATGAVLDISFPFGEIPAFQPFQNMTGTYTGSGGGTVLLASGRLGVRGADLTLNFPAGLFNWQGGTLDSGVQTIFNTGSITISGPANGNAILVGNMTNTGTIAMTGAGLQLNGGTLNNQPGGVFDFQTDNNITVMGTNFGAVNNSGIIRKSVGSISGSSELRAPLNNASNGTIDVRAGTLKLTGGGNSNGGLFTVSSGATLDLTGGTSTLFVSGTYTGTGAGTVLLSSGTLNAGNGAHLIFNMAPGLFQWAGGTLNTGNRDLLNQGSITISGNTSSTLIGTLNNSGMMRLVGATFLLNNGSLNDLAGSTFDIESDGGISTVGAGSVNNAGIFSKSAGMSSGINAPFNNPSGTTFSSSGTLAFNAAVLQISGSTLTAGTWQVLSGGQLTINTAGTITANNGTLILSGPGSSFTNLGSLASNTGTLILNNGASYTTSASFVNAGTVTIGPSSVLHVGGTFTQSAAGTFGVQINGPPSSGLFGQLASTGAATLAGNLSYTFMNGLTPAQGDQYQILTANSVQGTFNSQSSPQIGHNLALFPHYNAANVTLATSLAITHVAPQLAFVVGFDHQVYAQKLDGSGHSTSGYFLLQIAPGQLTQVSAITPATDASNNAIVFAIGLDNQVYEQKFTSTGDPNGTWTLVKPGTVKAIAAGSDASHRPELFAIGIDSQVYALQFDAAGNPGAGYYFPLQVAPGVTTTVLSVGIGRDASYNPLVFAIGLDSQVYEVKLDANGNQNGTWSLTQPGRVHSIQVSQDGFLNPELFVIGLDNQIYGQQFDAQGNTRGNYFLVQPGIVLSMSVGHDASNNPVVFAVGIDSQVYDLHFDSNGNAMGTYNLAQPGQVKATTVGYSATNTPSFFAIGLDDNLYSLQLDANGNPVGNYGLTQPGGIFAARLSV